ncbi:MAG: hypothetical protein ACQERC_03590 [Bacteroidota bacterium]
MNKSGYVNSLLVVQIYMGIIPFIVIPLHRHYKSKDQKVKSFLLPLALILALLYNFNLFHILIPPNKTWMDFMIFIYSYMDFWTTTSYGVFVAFIAWSSVSEALKILQLGREKLTYTKLGAFFVQGAALMIVLVVVVAIFKEGEQGNTIDNIPLYKKCITSGLIVLFGVVDYVTHRRMQKISNK